MCNSILIVWLHIYHLINPQLNLMIKKVLCVDDDTIALTISQLLLKRTGLQPK